MVTAQQVLATRVGVAPGTTTFTLGACCDSDERALVQRQRFFPNLMKIVADVAAAAVPVTKPPPAPQMPMRALLSPYATFEELHGRGAYNEEFKVKSLNGIGSFFKRFFRGGLLGMVLSPYGDISPRMYSEIVAVMKNTGPTAYCGTYDASYHTRGEPGFYHDTQMGAIPSDLQLARIRGYTPVMSSWAPFDNYSWAPLPWYPPNGLPSSGGIRPVGPPISPLQLRGLGEDVPTTITPPPVDPAQAALDALKAHQDRVFSLTVVSTMAVASTAVINALKHIGEQRKKKHKDSILTPTSMPSATMGRARSRRRGRR